MADAPAEHKARAETDGSSRSVTTAVLTVSDTRTTDTDTSGQAIVDLLSEAGHRVVARAIVRDEPDAIAACLDRWLTDTAIRLVITTGGTGLARRDTTVEVARSVITTEIEGFGELFRMISYEEIGSAAMLSRATAGLVARSPEHGGDTLLFALPGSTNAVRTAMTKLILPEAGHLINQRK